MGLSRRNALIGLGGIVAGGGALVGTGAFTTVQAERTVTVETAGDASAFLALAPSGEPNGQQYAADNANGENGETIEIAFDGTDEDSDSALNQNAITTIRRIVQVTNNGTQPVESLTLAMSDPRSQIDVDATFDFTVTDSDGTQEQVGNGDDILGSGGLNNTLTAGESIEFGMVIDLLNGGNSDGDLPNGDYNLTITANTASS